MHDVSSSCYHGSSPAGPRPGPPCAWRTWRTSRSAGRSERRWSRWHRCCFTGLLGDAGSFWGLGRCVLFFPQTVCPHWGVLTVERRVPDQGAHSGLRHFTRKFSYKVALVKFWHAFRLCRLAQNVCPRSGLNLGCGIFPLNFSMKWLFCLLWNADVHFDCAGSHEVRVPLVGSSWPRHFPCKCLRKVTLVKSWHVFRLRQLAQSVCPRSGLNPGCGIFPLIFRTKWLLPNLYVTLISTAQAHAKCGSRSWDRSSSSTSSSSSSSSSSWSSSSSSSSSSYIIIYHHM